MTGTVPSALMRKGDFSELLDPNNVWFGRVVTIRDPLTGQPFANNVIPASQLSPNGLALLNTFPLPTDGFRRGNTNWIGVSPNPRDTRKDTACVRLCARLRQSDCRARLALLLEGRRRVPRPVRSGAHPMGSTEYDVGIQLDQTL